jgi:DNA-binding Xre family transcriptional regulator
MDDPLWNDAMGLQVIERYELWSGVRRAEVMQQVRKIMRDKGISNLDLAQRLKVSEPAMSRMLKGDQNVKLDTLYRIADALDEPLHITFGDEPC